MKVVLIGAGNVATVLGRLIKKAGHEVVQVISRNPATAKQLAEELGCAYSEAMIDIDHSADMYVVAMSDAALNEIKECFRLGNKIVVHTAGSVSKDVLKDITENYGVLYPLQSIRKENNNPNLAIPLLVDCNNEFTTNEVLAFAKTISANVGQANEEERLKLHIAAVFVNNFTNHLYKLAAAYCQEEKVDFKMLLPLISETAERLKYVAPADTQTGPAMRKDIITLDKHLRMLSAHPKLRNVYLKMTDSIMND